MVVNLERWGSFNIEEQRFKIYT